MEPNRQLQQSSDLTAKDSVKDLKRLVWLYFLLLIFEGALRKWVLPGMATPLLVIRDPVALLLIGLSWQRGLFPKTPYMAWMLLIGALSFLTTLVIGHGNLFVALYGLRILLIHFPLIFVIGVVFNREDVLKMGKAFLWLSLPMVVLIFLQFYSPQYAWVNRGVGGDMVAQDSAGPWVTSAHQLRFLLPMVLPFSSAW